MLRVITAEHLSRVCEDVLLIPFHSQDNEENSLVKLVIQNVNKEAKFTMYNMKTRKLRGLSCSAMVPLLSQLVAHTVPWCRCGDYAS